MSGVSAAPSHTGSHERWVWFCGFYSGSRPGEQTHGSAATFDQARADFEKRRGQRFRITYRSRLRGMARAARLDRAEICGDRSRRQGADPMKYVNDRPFADPEKAARKLLGIGSMRFATPSS